MRDLCFLSCHVREPQRARLIATCIRLIDRLNPGIAMLMIDNGSPLDPLGFLPREWRDCGANLDGGLIPLLIRDGRHLCRFSDGIGHFNADRHRDPPPQDGLAGPS